MKNARTLFRLLIVMFFEIGLKVYRRGLWTVAWICGLTATLFELSALGVENALTGGVWLFFIFFSPCHAEYVSSGRVVEALLMTFLSMGCSRSEWYVGKHA